MATARKLLEKVKKNKRKIVKNFTKIHQLSENPDVFDIIAEKKEITKRLEIKLSQQEELKLNTNIKGFSVKGISLQRVDYDFPSNDYGLELIVPPGIITASQIGSGETVEILGGSLEGRSLEVIKVINSTTLRLDDLNTFSGMENGIEVRFILNNKE